MHFNPLLLSSILRSCPVMTVQLSYHCSVSAYGLLGAGDHRMRVTRAGANRACPQVPTATVARRIANLFRGERRIIIIIVGIGLQHHKSTVNTEYNGCALKKYVIRPTTHPPTHNGAQQRWLVLDYNITKVLQLPRCAINRPPPPQAATVLNSGGCYWTTTSRKYCKYRVKWMCS